MESDISRNEVLGAKSPPEPHFDEEATLLSARPVIPLQAVQAEALSRRRLTFGVTIVSLLVGAFGATFIYKRGQKQTATIVRTSSPVSEQSGQEGAQVAAAGVDAANSRATARPAAGDTDEVVASKSPAAGASTPWKKLAPPIPQSDESGSVERRLRHTQRLEARRLGQRAAREVRRDVHGRKGQSADDLLRIREIFEGSSRP